MEDTTSRKEEAIERFKRLSDNCEERCRRIQEHRNRSATLECLIEDCTISKAEMRRVAELKMHLATDELALETAICRNADEKEIILWFMKEIDIMASYLESVDEGIMSMVEKMCQSTRVLEFHQLVNKDSCCSKKERYLMGLEDLHSHYSEIEFLSDESPSMVILKRNLLAVRNERIQSSSILAALEKEYSNLVTLRRQEGDKN